MDADAGRKQEEEALHDLLRGLDKSGPAYAYYMSNSKFYAVDGVSRRYYYGWLAENASGKQVLDYGSGAGYDTVCLGRVADHVVGIDIPPVSVERSIGRAADAGVGDKVEVLVVDAEKVKFLDDSSMWCASMGFSLISISTAPFARSRGPCVPMAVRYSGRQPPTIP